jgi:hypothetical protein
MTSANYQGVEISDDDEETRFIVVQGTPRVFHRLSDAEEKAAELCERDRASYTILAIPADVLKERALIARYQGVVLDVLNEEETTGELE